jgi:hypothetical protein
MKTHLTFRSAFFNPRLLMSFALCSAGVLLALAGLSKSVTATGRHAIAAQTSGTWKATGSLSVGRIFFTATLLTNGRVLVAGGSNATATLSSAELYDPVTGLWTPTGSMTTPRAAHTATLLSDGKVLVAGGQVTTSTASAELYDPNTETWTLTGNMTTPRSGHTAILIMTGPLSGMVLAAGGGSTCSACTPLVASAELYNPSTETWTPTDDMTIARYWDPPPPAAVLPDGSVLVVGGATCCPYHWFSKAESYDPENQTWTPTSPKVTDANADPALLPDGKILVAGGVKGTQPTSVNVADAEIYDPAMDAWTATASMSSDRSEHTLTLLPSGQALVAGGASGGWGVCNDLTSTELYDPNSGTWSPGGNMRAARHIHIATLLPNGQVLAAGGINCQGNILASAELYTPSAETGTCLPPPTDLVSWWSGDKTAEDVQGTNPGRLVGGASFTRGMVGPGFLFDGINDGVVIPNSTSLNQTRVTLDAWVYPTGNAGLNRHVISKDQQFVARQYVLALNDDDKFHAFVVTTNGEFNLAGSTTPALNSWYHLAMTHDGQTLRLYVDGVLNASMLAPGDIIPTKNSVIIGANGLGNFFKGIIDEAQIFSRALSDAEIMAIYQAGATGQCKPEIFVSSITPSYEVVGHGFLISTSIVIQDENGIGIGDASVQIKTILPSGSVLAFPATTDETGQATISFVSRDSGRYKFTVQKVSHPTRVYAPSLNIETSDTLVIP